MATYIWQHATWAEFRWDAAVLLPLLGECRKRQGMLLAEVSALGMAQAVEAQADLLTDEAITTAAIEGETLARESVRSSVARQLGLPTAGLSTDRSADGLVSVLLDATADAASLLTVQRLHGWHAALFPTGYSGFTRIRVGRWRGEGPMRVVSGAAGRERVHYEAPPAKAVPGEMRSFLSWFNQNEPDADGLIRAAVAHFRFVAVHPYDDGNGRLARALTDRAIARDDRRPARYYSMSSQIMKERLDYYAALGRCSTGDGDLTPWLAWFLGCFGRAIAASEQRLVVVLDKTRFWQRNAGLPLTDRQRKVVNRLLDAGRAGFAGGLTTRKYVGMTGASRATAFREIENLLMRGILVKRAGGGRSVSYDLRWDEAGA
jgi:Fic family protein